jgi:hypothetical protein
MCHIFTICSETQGTAAHSRFNNFAAWPRTDVFYTSCTATAATAEHKCLIGFGFYQLSFYQ